MGRHRAYGYRTAADGKTLETEPGEQATIAKILELRSNGLSERAIAAHGFASRSGRALSQVQVHRILVRSRLAA